MNPYVTGAMIKALREKQGLTQTELAQRLCVSDKTVSKWETAKGYPDISLLEPIAKAFGISITELLSGSTVSNVNVSGNMLRSKFYVCPVCGNIIHAMGEAVVHCHGIQLTPAQPEETDERHKIFIEGVEDEYFVRLEHDMTKHHYISFIAALSMDRIQMVRLYPEGNPETRFKMNGVTRILFYCNRDGLFSVRVHPAIDGKPHAYDNAAERKKLEETAHLLFG